MTGQIVLRTKLPRARNRHAGVHRRLYNSHQMQSPRLGDVVGVLDATVLRVGHAGDLDARAGAVTILDRTDPESLRPGAIVLAVGVDAAAGDAVELMDRAAAAGAVAVVMRTAEPLPERLLRGRVTLLTVPPETDWGQLYALLRTASSGAGTVAGAAGVPVGDLFALADAVAAAVGAPVTVEDPQWRVLAYSNLDAQPIDEARRQTILGRVPPAEWLARLDEADVRTRLRTGSEIIRFEYPGIATRVVAPVRAGGELIGSLWAAEVGEPLSSEAEAELVRFGELAALHLIANRSADDLRRRARGALVRELLEGRTPAEARRLRPPLGVVAFEHEGWHGDPDRIVSIAGLYAESVHRDALCASLDDRVWAIVPCDDRDALDQLARRVVERAASSLQADVRAAIAPAAAAVAELPASRRAALQALAVLAAGRRDGPVVHADDVRAHAALLELLDAAAGIEALDRGRLRSLSADLLATLGAWLDHHGDVAAAAAAVGIHANTLRYRLRRIGEITGIDLADPDERLVAALELRLLRREEQV